MTNAKIITRLMDGTEFGRIDPVPPAARHYLRVLARDKKYAEVSDFRKFLTDIRDQLQRDYEELFDSHRNLLHEIVNQQTDAALPTYTLKAKQIEAINNEIQNLKQKKAALQSELEAIMKTAKQMCDNEAFLRDVEFQTKYHQLEKAHHEKIQAYIASAQEGR
jgi:hypothetical protein